MEKSSLKMQEKFHIRKRMTGTTIINITCYEKMLQMK